MAMKVVSKSISPMFVLLFLRVPLIQSASDWSYTGENGPSNWGNLAATCGGSNQSPVNINISSAPDDADIGGITLTNFGSRVGQGTTIRNNGHTVQVDLTGSSYSISGGGLTGTFNLDQFHFHWGTTDSTGSEHTLDGKQYPMEVHFVSHSTKYSDLTEAVGHTDGLAVLGFFFEIDTETNLAWEPLTDLLGNITNPGDQVYIPSSLRLNTLIPTNRRVFYRYQGSLTTPTCNEVVTWTVFETAIKISSHQMNKFRSLKDSKGEGISGNFRPVQSLQGRTVYRKTSGLLCALTSNC